MRYTIESSNIIDWADTPDGEAHLAYMAEAIRDAIDNEILDDLYKVAAEIENNAYDEAIKVVTDTKQQEI